jgi:hypothetical protein
MAGFPVCIEEAPPEISFHKVYGEVSMPAEQILVRSLRRVLSSIVIH